MKRKYIIFYAHADGFGSTDIVVSRKERPNNIENIHKIEDVLSEFLHSQIAVINFKYVGISWK